MYLLEQLQIHSVKIRSTDVLRLNTAGIEVDAFAVGQRSQLLADPCVISHHACADAFHLCAFTLFLGHFPILNFLLAATCRFLDEVHVLLTHFHDGGGAG